MSGLLIQSTVNQMGMMAFTHFTHDVSICIAVILIYNVEPVQFFLLLLPINNAILKKQSLLCTFFLFFFGSAVGISFVEDGTVGLMSHSL